MNSKIPDVDADVRPKWKEVADNLPPVPPSPQPGEYYDLCTPVTDDTALLNSLDLAGEGLLIDKWLWFVEAHGQVVCEHTTHGQAPR